ncbi:hypothetical protein MTR_6g055870 [Medicago truncatula]|uniref:Uncharacterized protein n=1 Tax=Medicago truncatula TaxID=3880 RepID=G7KM23_MEDTR|nr:hypothetical protein MTR_6g055870 [Medicago truncatula]
MAIAYKDWLEVLPLGQLPSFPQVYNKKVRPREIQERDFVPKKVLPFQPDSRGKWMPNYEGLCAKTLATMDVDKPASRCSQGILCQKIKVKRASASASRAVTLQKRNMAKHYGKDLYVEQDAVTVEKYKKKIKAR